jgi:hypothetical protein
MVKYIHKKDYKNIAGKGECRENIDILLYCWRRSRVWRAKCMALRPNIDLCILLAYTSGFGRFSVFFPRELDKAGSICGKMAIVYQVQRVLSTLGQSVSGSGLRREMPKI